MKRREEENGKGVWEGGLAHTRPAARFEKSAQWTHNYYYFFNKKLGPAVLGSVAELEIHLQTPYRVFC